MVLFNLPRPWILVCGKHKRPREIQIATYKILNRTELCECSLTAGTFSLDETLVQCTPEIHNATDGIFSMSYAINKIIFDYLQVNQDVMLEREVLQALSELLSIKLQYDWSSVQWHNNTELPSNVINKKPVGVAADLGAVMDFIVENIDTEAFQDENEFRKAQSNFQNFITYADRWRIFEFVLAMLGLVTMTLLVIICIFRAKILESIILSSAVLDDYKFINSGTESPSSGVKAFMLPSMDFDKDKQIKVRPPTLPPNWEETFSVQDKQIVFLNTVITGALITLGIVAILYTICKKCHYVSSIPQVCFPVYPVSNFLRGMARTDIFVEIINISTARAAWAYMTTCAVHPSQLQITGYPTA